MLLVLIGCFQITEPLRFDTALEPDPGYLNSHFLNLDARKS